MHLMCSIVFLKKCLKNLLILIKNKCNISNKKPSYKKLSSYKCGLELKSKVKNKKIRLLYTFYMVKLIGYDVYIQVMLKEQKV